MNGVLKSSLPSVVLLFTATSCGILMTTPPVRTTGYCGDGTIARLKDAVNPGFKVEFEVFSLAEPHLARYTLECLPKPSWHDLYHAGLVLQLTEEENVPSLSLPTWLPTGSSGTLALRLESRTGRILFDHQAEVANLGWSRYSDNLPYGRPKLMADDQMPWTCPSNREDHDYQQPWALYVHYEPGPDSRATQVRIRFMAGGME